MKGIGVDHKKLVLIFSLVLSLIAVSCTQRTEKIMFQNDGFKYEVDHTGKNLHFIDKKNGVDYLNDDTVSYCASIMLDGKEFNVTSVAFDGEIMKLDFGETAVSAELLVTKAKDHINFKVKTVTGNPWSLTFMNVPLKIDGSKSHEPFGALILALNLNTHVFQIPVLQTLMKATCYSRLGLEGAEISMLGLPQDMLLPTIRNIIKDAEDIPYSDQGGAWAQMAKDGFVSYLMSGAGELTEETVDEWIEACESHGFYQIDNHGGGEFFKFGSFEINKKLYPDGWESFKRINEKLHDAGITSFLHTYTFFIDKNSEMVTPVPSEDLGYFNSFTLASSVDAGTNELIVNESTADISAITGFWLRNSATIRIGNELINFTGVTKTPPYKFTGCERGAMGTQALKHQANDSAFHLMEMFYRFVPGENTELYKEVARRTAQIVDDYKFDGIYFDAADGSDLWGGEEFYWHYGPKFVMEVAKYLKKPVSMELAGMTHLWWHYRSRWQTFDSPVRGYKRFVDIHLASIKSYTNKHGEFLGHTPVIDSLARLEQSPVMLPLFLGWWMNYPWTVSPQVEMTHTDDIEYLCCKMIGNSASTCDQGHVDRKSIENIPLLGRLNAIFKQYEELRHKNYFSDDVRKQLREPGKDFTLFQEESGDWNFKPVVYSKHKVTGLTDESDKWTVNNEFSTQPVKLRIQPLMSVKPYDSPSNIFLTEYTSNELLKAGNAEGVTGGITSSDDLPGNAKAAINFSASSSGSAPKEGTWIKMEKTFTPVINLDNNQALGVWIKGDGNGQLLNFRTGNPDHVGYPGVRGDHFVDIDFIGWRYFELVEIESERFSDYLWEPYVETREIVEGFNVYNSYKATVDMKIVDRLQFWYNDLPANKKVNTVIGPVKALPMVPITITNPSVTIDGETIVFPVKMESGMYLELKSDHECILYSPKGKVLQEVSLNGKVPELKSGNNSVSFSCEGTKAVSTRVSVTVISEGKPL